MCLRYTLLAVACLAIGTAPCAGASAHTNNALPAGAVARLGDVRFWWKNCYISALAFSPDSKTLAVAANWYQHEPSEEPAVRLLEIPSGADRRRLPKLPPAMRAVGFSPDGQSLAGIHSSDDGYSLRLSAWDLAERTRRYSFELGNQQSPAVAYSPDGRCLAATAYKAVSLRDAATGRELRRLEGHETEVIALAFSPDGKLLASGSSATDSQGKFAGSIILLWDVAAGKSLRKIAFARQEPFPAFQFSSDSKILAAWKRDADIQLNDVSTGRYLRKIAGKFSAAAFSADGKLVATGGPVIRLWELPAGRELRSFPGYAEMRLLTFSPDGKTLAAVKGDRGGDRGGRVLLWDVVRGEEIIPYVGHRGAVQSLSCTADGHTLISAGSDGTIRLWDVATGKQQRVLEEREADFSSVAVSPDGKIIAAKDAAGKVTFWSSTAKKLAHYSLNEPRSMFGTWSGPQPILAFSAGGRIAVFGRQVWEGSQAKIARTLRADEDEGTPIALSPDGALFASLPAPSEIIGLSHDSDLLRVRQFESGKEVCRIKGAADDAFWAAAFSPDGKLLAVSRSQIDQGHGMLHQHQLIFWEVASGKHFLKIDLQNRAQALAFSPDGRLLATASGLSPISKYERSIRIWDVTTGELLEELPGHGGLVNALLFSPDGRRLFSGSADGTILVWDTRWPHPRPRQLRGDLSAKQLRAAWEDLAGADAAQAFRSLSDLAAVPRRAVPFLREHLPAPPPLAPRRIARLIADLDSDEFAVREKARLELEKLDELAEEALRKTLQSRPSLEMRRRVEGLLARLHLFPPPAAHLQMSRAMLALEWMDTAEARQLIEALAQGTPGAWLTREAKAVQQRLSRLPPARP